MTTPNLELPEWEANQNQPHVPVDTALRVLDCLCQLRVLSRSEATPPVSPDDGDCYIPAAGASGDWAGHANHVAMFISNAWEFRTPKGGWEAWVVDDDQRVRYDVMQSPAAWIVIS